MNSGTINHRRGGWLRALAAAAALALVAPLPAAGAEPVEITGITEPLQDVALGIAVPGRVAKIHVVEGARVKQGDLLLELDNRLEQLEAERRKLIWQDKTELEAAARRVKTLQAHLATTRELFTATGSVNREALENQELEYDLARTEHLRLEAAEQREEVEYRIARELLARRSLHAPFSGIVAQVLVGPGENSEVEKPLIRQVDTSRALFVASVEPQLAARLREGRGVELELPAGDQLARVKATIVFVSPVVDPASGLQQVKARFDNKSGQVVPGVPGTMLLTAD